MLVFWKERLVVLAVPKTGTTALEAVAVLREPVDWLKSWYRYRHREGLAGHPNSTRGMSFDVFVTDYCRGRQPAHAKVGSPARFVRDGQGEIAVDHLFRYESQARLVRFLEERLGASPVPERLNVSPSIEITLSPKVEATLRRKRPEEFE